jgi:hypothetical protein
MDRIDLNLQRIRNALERREHARNAGRAPAATEDAATRPVDQVSGPPGIAAESLLQQLARLFGQRTGDRPS